jgi:hypothetical protein
MNSRILLLTTLLALSIFSTTYATSTDTTTPSQQHMLETIYTEFTKLDAYVFGPCTLASQQKLSYERCKMIFFARYNRLSELLKRSQSTDITRYVAALQGFVTSYNEITHKLHLLTITTAQSPHAFSTKEIPVAAQQEAILTFLQQATTILQKAWNASDLPALVGNDEQVAILEKALSPYLPQRGYVYNPSAFNVMHEALSKCLSSDNEPTSIVDADLEALALQSATYWEYALKFHAINKNTQWQDADVLITEQAAFDSFILDLDQAYINTPASTPCAKLRGLMRDNMTNMYQALQRSVELVHCKKQSPGTLSLYMKHLRICDANNTAKPAFKELFQRYAPLAHDYFTSLSSHPLILLRIEALLQTLNGIKADDAKTTWTGIERKNKDLDPMIEVLTTIEKNIYESIPGATPGYSRIWHYLTAGKWFDHGILNHVSQQADGNFAVNVGGQTITIKGGDVKSALAQAALLLAPNLSSQLSRFLNMAPQDGLSTAENAAALFSRLKAVDPASVEALANQMGAHAA